MLFGSKWLETTGKVHLKFPTQAAHVAIPCWPLLF
jgi:hypothetical protein